MSERDVLEESIRAHKSAIEKAERGLKALDEPTLKNGDYYHDGCNSIVLIKCGHKKWSVSYKNGAFYERSTSDMLDWFKSLNYRRVGNIFDHTEGRS